MLLTEFFTTAEGDSYAKSTSASSIAEAKRKISASEDPCWKGYHMVGTKSKDGREVPNCVPGAKGSMNESEEMSHIIQARELVKKALKDTNKRHEYFDYIKYLRAKHGADYSTQIHQAATTFDKETHNGR